jgi:hypothetical protein
MKLMRKTTLLVAALALVTVFSDEAAAQAPTVTFQVNGSQVQVAWDAIPGATFYEVFVTGSLVGGPIPVPTNFFVVAAPPGTYIVQVRARSASQTGPLSAPVTIPVGSSAPPPGCPTVGAPTVTVSASGQTVTISWDAVAGTAGYIVQVGNTPGGTAAQVQLPAGQTSYAAAGVPFGTYYVRVLAGSGCGAPTSSAEQTVTVGASTPSPGTPPPTGGAGPRAADPTPGASPLCVSGRPELGYCIHINTLGYASGIIASVAAQFPGDLFNSCASRGGNMNFVFRVLSRLRAIDKRWGLNYKRGHLGGLSEDIIAYNPTNRPDDGEAQIYLFDLIGNHCPDTGSAIAGIDLSHGYNSTVNDTWLAALSGRFGPGVFGTQFGARWTITAYLAAGFTN